MSVKEYVENMKNIEEVLLKFLDRGDHLEENFSNLVNLLKEQNIPKDRYDLKIFLYLIAKIINNHHHFYGFYSKIEQILILIKEEILEFYSNEEIFNIFKKNKRILLFLFDEKMITINNTIYQEIMNYQNMIYSYPEYFVPELRAYIEKEIQSSEDWEYKADLYSNLEEIPLLKENYSKFNEKRKNGENDDYLSKIIQNDLIEEFIVYINKKNYPINSSIEISIYETNNFLLKQYDTNLIEYAAFHGSAQIFKYLYKNRSKLTPEIWLYAIHGYDEEIFKLLEDEKENIEFSYIDCFIESIKCHHNFLTNYIETNFQNEEEDEDFTYLFDHLLYAFRYYNFAYFLDHYEFSCDNFLLYACKFDYYKIVEFLLNTLTYEIPFRKIAEYNKPEILTLFLLRICKKIKNNLFEGCEKMKQIKIPCSITSIGNSSFSRCSSLKQILIPYSVYSIGKFAFYECSSLTKIIIPSSIKTIGKYAFSKCTSLERISISSFISSIEKFTFYECLSLTKIKIPQSVTSIGDHAFEKCTSLTQISIPSSVTSIGKYAFLGVHH